MITKTTGPYTLKVSDKHDALIIFRLNLSEDEARKITPETEGKALKDHDNMFAFIERCIVNRKAVYEFLKAVKE